MLREEATKTFSASLNSTLLCLSLPTLSQIIIVIVRNKSGELAIFASIVADERTSSFASRRSYETFSAPPNRALLFLSLSTVSQIIIIVIVCNKFGELAIFAMIIDS